MSTLDIKVFSNYISYTPDVIVNINYTSANDEFMDALAPYAFYQITIGPLDEPNAIFPTIKDAMDYYYSAGSASVLSQFNTNTGFGYTLGRRLDYLTTSTVNADDLRQPVSDLLTEMADLEGSILPDSMLRVNTSGDFEVIPMKPFIVDLMDADDASEVKTWMGLGSAANASTSDFAAASHTHTASQITDFSTAADARITAQKGVNSGLASLDSGGKLLTTQLPGLAITSTSVVASQVAQLALTAQEGDVAVRSDLSKTYIKNSGTAGTMADWTEILTPATGVSSFNGRTGAVSPAGGDYTTSTVAEGSNLYYTDARAQAVGSKAVSGTTVKSGVFPVFKSATVTSGVATFHLTNDGLSTGTALFPNGPDQDSVQLSFNDYAASYQPGWAWSNSNKTLTVTVNKLGTANILTGILGQVAAPNGFTVKLTVFGN